MINLIKTFRKVDMKRDNHMNTQVYIKYNVCINIGNYNWNSLNRIK